MPRRFALVLCLLMSTAAFAGGFSKSQDFRAATPEELAMKSLPSDPGSAAAVLDWVEVDDDNTSSSTEYVRVKIFTDEGKKYGDVEIPYIPTYPVYGRIGDISARTIRPDGTVVPFDGKVYDKIIYKAGGRALRAKTFSLADVQAGSILEYRYQRRWAESVLFDTLWILQRDIPIAHLKMSLKPYAANYSNDFSTFFIYVGLPQGKKPEKVSDAYELELTNVAPVPHEPFSPPDEAMTAHVKFYYTRSRVEPAKFWDSETAVQRKQIEAFLGKSQNARAMGQQLTAGAQAPVEKLKSLYAKAQSMVRRRRDGEGRVVRGPQHVRRALDGDVRSFLAGGLARGKPRRRAAVGLRGRAEESAHGGEAHEPALLPVRLSRRRRSEAGDAGRPLARHPAAAREGRRRPVHVRQ